MVNNRKLAILDFDDTLFLTFECVRAATNELIGRDDLDREGVRALDKQLKNQIYDLAYTKYRYLGRPNLAMFKYLKANKKDYEIIVMTANVKFLNAKLRSQILTRIRKLGIMVSGFAVRTDREEEDEVWKLSALKKLAADYSSIEFYEDKRDNIEYIKKRLPARNIAFYLVEKSAINLFK